MQASDAVAYPGVSQPLPHTLQDAAWAHTGSPARSVGSTAQLTHQEASQHTSQHRRALSEALGHCQSPAGPQSGSMASSAGTAAAPAASPALAVLAVTARELLHEIEAAAADSPMSVAASSSKSSRRKGHKSKSSSKHRYKHQEQDLDFHTLQKVQQQGHNFMQSAAVSPGTQAAVLFDQQQQYMQVPAPALQQLQQEQVQKSQPFAWQEQQESQQGVWQQTGAQCDPGASTSDCVGWSAVLQKYEQHKMHMAQLLTEIDQHQQQQQANEQLATAAAVQAAASAPAVFAPAPGATGSPTLQSSKSAWSSRRVFQQDTSGAGAAPASAAMAMAMQGPTLDPGLRLRIQQLRGSASDGCFSTGRSAGLPAVSTSAGAVTSSAGGAAGVFSPLKAAATAGPAAAAAVAGVSAAVGGGDRQAELEYLLAERHLAAALLKHLAAVVAADAAATASSCGGQSGGKHEGRSQRCCHQMHCTLSPAAALF